MAKPIRPHPARSMSGIQRSMHPANMRAKAQQIGKLIGLPASSEAALQVSEEVLHAEEVFFTPEVTDEFLTPPDSLKNGQGSFRLIHEGTEPPAPEGTPEVEVTPDPEPPAPEGTPEVEVTPDPEPPAPEVEVTPEVVEDNSELVKLLEGSAPTLRTALEKGAWDSKLSELSSLETAGKNRKGVLQVIAERVAAIAT